MNLRQNKQKLSGVEWINRGYFDLVGRVNACCSELYDNRTDSNEMIVVLNETRGWACFSNKLLCRLIYAKSEDRKVCSDFLHHYQRSHEGSSLDTTNSVHNVLDGEGSYAFVRF